MRAVFQQKPPSKGKGKKKKNARTGHLRVAKDDEKSAAKVKVVDSTVPWKTIIATTIVTSVVSTLAVTAARFFMDRASQRKEIKQLLGAQGGQPVSQAQNPHVSEAAPVPVSREPLPHPTAPGSTLPGLPAPNFANPYAPGFGGPQRLVFPEAPHAGAASPSEPEWFSDWKRNQELWMANVEKRLHNAEVIEE